MDARGYFIVFGSFSLFVGMIIAGAVMESGPWARGLLAVGIVGVLVWSACGLWLVNAMNTDI